MPDVQSALAAVAAERTRDPLSPVTFVVPSHVAGLQLRRRLAEYGPFAAVRFETLPRIAELIAAGALAASDRRPLARPIGDYVAQQVAAESRGVLQSIADMPGYARILRKHFRRLRRGGITRPADAKGGPYGSHLDEVLRLYGMFRDATSAFYDDEDELDAAADVIAEGRSAVLADLGAVFVVPPGPLTAAGHRLLDALRSGVPSCTELSEPTPGATSRLLLAPDPASEAREVVRDVADALRAGLSLQEVAVFHGADRAYPGLLREHFENAAIPDVPLPGVPLAEKPIGRAALMLAQLPALEYSRVAVFDFLQVAPLRSEVPGGSAFLRPAPAYWDKLSREAGVVRGADAWRKRLTAAIGDISLSLGDPRNLENEPRARALEANREGMQTLADFVGELIARLDPLRVAQPAEQFIATFSRLVDAYIDDRAEGFEDLLHEIEQLGTVGAVGGSFSLASFVEALSANLEARYVRPARLGDGVVVGDYRIAAGLSFRHVSLCGAFEGALPAGPGPDALVNDRSWSLLRREFPLIEDVQLRLERARQGVERAVASAGGGHLLWSSPVAESGGSRDRYPSPYMVDAARVLDSRLSTASALRTAVSQPSILRRGDSPMSLTLRGTVLDPLEAGLREAILLRRSGSLMDDHRSWAAVKMLRARRSDRFTEYDGNIAGLEGSQLVALRHTLSPTSLERYGGCGFSYFCGSLLRIREVEEPAERQVMDAAARGELIHKVLERFFVEQKSKGRPQPGEAWGPDDEARILEIADEELDAASERGLTGLDVYAAHEARTIKADLSRFLAEDTHFRREFGTVPVSFEQRIPETEISGVRMTGRVDRVDRTPDGRLALVIDYKSGGTWGFDDVGSAHDPFVGGTKLQLPAYLGAAGDAERVEALYWFVTLKGGFERRFYAPTPDLSERYRRTVEAIADGIRNGSFPAVPGEEDERSGSFENCRYCDFTRICSRKRDTEFAAKSDGGGLGDWFKVQAVARDEATE